MHSNVFLTLTICSLPSDCDISIRLLSARHHERFILLTKSEPQNLHSTNKQTLCIPWILSFESATPVRGLEFPFHSTPANFKLPTCSRVRCSPHKLPHRVVYIRMDNNQIQHTPQFPNLECPCAGKLLTLHVDLDTRLWISIFGGIPYGRNQHLR